jgi:outer membrane protein assembly factor BamB
MKTSLTIVAIFCVLIFSLFAVERAAEFGSNWPQWRGPTAMGISPKGDPPVEWSETKNIKWKVETPGRGNSTPIIWGDTIYLLTAIETDKIVDTMDESAPESEQRRGRRRESRGVATKNVHRFDVLALDRNTGKSLWQRTVTEEWPKDRTHELGTWASNSPVTDGENLFAYFGSRGLYCLDFEGNIKWGKDFGQMEKVMSFGEGSSPLLYGDRIYIVWDHEGESFFVALDKSTGEELWKKARDEGSSWSTPFIVERNGQIQVIVSATNRIRSYETTTGDVIWECGGLTRNVIPMPLLKEDILYVTSGFRGAAFLAIDLARAKGDITGSDVIVWTHGDNTPYTPSPVLANGLIYMLRGNNGVLTCLDADDGEEYYGGERLEGLGNIYSSPIVAQDRIYFVGQKGTAFVVKQGKEFKILSQNVLDDNFIASPAVIGDDLFLRGYKYLYCISDD